MKHEPRHTRRRILKTSLTLGTAAMTTGCGQRLNAPDDTGEQPIHEAESTGDSTDPAVGDASVPSAALPGTAPVGYGELRGRFLFHGTVPIRRRLTVDADHEFCDQFEILEESLICGFPEPLKTERSDESESDSGSDSGGVDPSVVLPGVANVFVVCRTRGLIPHPELAEPSDAPDAPLPATVLLDNRDAIFQPHALTLLAGHQKLRIVNSDPIAQNVAFAPLGDRVANLVMPPADPEAADPGARLPTIEWNFRRPQPVPFAVRCNYHSWELAWVWPCETPYSAVTDRVGRFLLTRLPAGEHEFFAWHEQLGTFAFHATIRSDAHTDPAELLISDTWSLRFF